eukprot:scaffold22088_cov73-Cylindrotheca_fusiformis.AAC.1
MDRGTEPVPSLSRHNKPAENRTGGNWPSSIVIECELRLGGKEKSHLKYSRHKGRVDPCTIAFKRSRLLGHGRIPLSRQRRHEERGPRYHLGAIRSNGVFFCPMK